MSEFRTEAAEKWEVGGSKFLPNSSDALGFCDKLYEQRRAAVAAVISLHVSQYLGDQYVRFTVVILVEELQTLQTRPLTTLLLISPLLLKTPE